MDYFDPMGIFDLYTPYGSNCTINYSKVFPKTLAVGNEHYTLCYHNIPEFNFGYRSATDVASYDIIDRFPANSLLFDGAATITCDSHVKKNSYSQVSVSKSRRLIALPNQDKKEFILSKRTTSMEKAVELFGYENILSSTLYKQVNIDDWRKSY